MAMSIVRIKKRVFKDYFKEMPCGKIVRLVDNTTFIKDWMDIEIPYLRKNNIGIYLIGDFYIGQSINIRQRVMQHYKLCLKNEHVNTDFQNKFLELLKSGKTISLKILDNKADSNIEQQYIDEYRTNGFPLVNCNQRIYPKDYCSITKLIEKYKLKDAGQISKKVLISDLEKIRREFNQIQINTKN